MKALILIILSFLALSASAASDAITIHDMRANKFTSNGSTKIEHCVFSDTLTVNGSADLYHSKIKFGIINGSLAAHGVDVHALTVSGSASISAKSDVAELRASGSLRVNESYVDLATIDGSAYGNGAYIKKITVNNGDLYFVNSDLGKIFVNHVGDKKNAVVIKLLGKTTVRHLTINSPLTIITLDSESKSTFDKSVVISSGKVEYK